MFVKEVYQITRIFPSEEKFGLSSQMQRAAVSIVSTIAEGTSRLSNKEKIRFLEITYINENSFEQKKQDIDKIANKLNALIRRLND
ncbi:MAG: four helix bundle protein [Prevotellaceae bacterium]|jgi:hypothetical protein|nr:four helix bundle protein [Prevotellaceae bacterium]